MLSTLASKNKTPHDAPLFTLAAVPKYSENLKFQDREKASLQKLEVNPLSWFFKISQASVRLILRLGGRLVLEPDELWAGH